MILETVVVGPVEANCYIIAESDKAKAVIIDPGAEENKIREVLGAHKLKPAFVVNTHGHFDHIGCDDKFGVFVYVHKLDEPLLKDAKLNFSSYFSTSLRVESPLKTLEDKEEIGLGEIKLQVIHVPGHTPGGIALLMKKPKDKILFTGDTLFCQGIGRTDLPGGDGALLIKSIKERLFKLADDTVIYPGHGPSSTIGKEKCRSL